MKLQWEPISIVVLSLIVIATTSCNRKDIIESKQNTPSADAAKQEQATIQNDKLKDIEEKIPAYKPDQADSAQQERIALLLTMLSELDDAEDSDTASNPHAERLQDPEAIKEAIRQLKEGKDICTRCLMECGAAM